MASMRGATDPMWHRLIAPIRKAGSRHFVDIPAEISAALADRTVAGRVRVRGLLNGTPITATLVPVGGGHHRLYLNGGMRAAAGVREGDAVEVDLAAIEADEVPVPADVAAALDAIPGAGAVFDAFRPSHRRELVRFVDDARSAATRRRRIHEIVAQVAGEPSPRPERPAPPERPLWTCPRCGSQFVTRNQYHSCGRHDLRTPFEGKPELVRELFDRFRQLVEACGPVAIVPYRDRVGFMVRVRFAGALPRSRWLVLNLWLTRRIDSPRFHKVETLSPNVHIHLLRIASLDELDEEVAAWTREAYAVGRQEHLRP